MTTTFDDREQAYERKFAHDMELEFKILARMHHLLGLWAAEKLEFGATKAEEYSQALLEEMVGKDSKVSAKEKIQRDFKTADLEVSDKEIDVEMEKLLQVAREQLLKVSQ